MSIALYKYDNAVVPAERNVIYCQPLSTEEIYLKCVQLRENNLEEEYLMMKELSETLWY